MGINFNQIPVDLLVPAVYTEVDPSRLQQGLAVEPHRVLVMGQKLAGGSATADQLVRVLSFTEAKSKFGQGSMLAGMFERLFAVRRDMECWALPVADNGAGVQAAGQFTITGPSTAAGTLSVWIAGRLVQVAVASGATAASLATALTAAINAVADLPVTAAVNGVDNFKVDVTARHKGAEGNSIDLRVNYADGEKLPAGVGVTITAMASGATNPTLTTALANLGDEWFQTAAFPWTDATSLTAIQAKLLERWGPTKQIEGIAYTAKRDTHANLLTFGDGRNDEFVSCMGGNKLLMPPWEHAAVYAIQAAFEAKQDPALPVQDVPLTGILPPATADRFTRDERELLLHDGIATFTVDPSGRVLIERAVTTYQKDASNNPDRSYLDSETLRIIMRLRYTARVFFRQRYPRYKIADDATPVSGGQKIVRPKDIIAACHDLFDLWQDAGLVENAAQFKADLAVQRNATDKNRFDIVLPPDLINQLRVMAIQVQPRL